jgi:glutamate synthase (NADPH) small chain
MKPLVAATAKDKYIWCDVPRVDPPKREAAERVEDFKETYALYDAETVKAQAARCLQCGEPFCTIGCPLGNHIPEWLALTAEGKFLEAAAVSRSTSNLPEVCSRVCPQERGCEEMCTLGTRGVPIPIGAIEKFINEYAFTHQHLPAPRVMPNGRSVAVVGSGPAGLSCADELAQLGYSVTVFESQSTLGGLLVNGIPSFKLDKVHLERRLELLRERGIQFRTKVAVGKDVTLHELLNQFDAIFLGMGAQQAKPLDIPGAELQGIFPALPFLIEKNVGAASNLPTIPVAGKRVVVLGGGDTAMDCLRTALRCHALEAVCLYRRDLANMPGSRKEYHNAVEEGAQFHFLTNPLKLIGDAQGRVTEVRCAQMKLGEPDAQGRRRPYPVPGSEFSLPADVVLIAFGFDPVTYPPESDLSQVAVNDWGGMVVDDNQMTSMSNVFAGGDLVRGANLVVYAVRDGRRAAQGIHRFLSQRQ